MYRNKEEKVLVLAPTRELALQIEQEFRDFTRGMRMFSVACVGGAPIGKQVTAIKLVLQFRDNPPASSDE